jgi:DNA-binding GntR family transcriptional regulator
VAESSAAREAADASLGSSQRAYVEIRRAIVEGGFRPGQRLIEQRISDEFDLSRTPVREAIRRLEAEGLVRTERNRGAVVREVTAEDVRDLYELRARLEALAAERAAARADETDIKELDDAIEDFDAMLELRGVNELELVRRIDQANSRFHTAVLEAAGHSRLDQLLRTVVDLPLVFRAFRVFSRPERERSNLFHRMIRDAIVQGDPQRAHRLMLEHIYLGRDTLLSHIEQHDNGLEGALFDGPGAVRGKRKARTAS